MSQGSVFAVSRAHSISQLALCLVAVSRCELSAAALPAWSGSHPLNWEPQSKCLFVFHKFPLSWCLLTAKDRVTRHTDHLQTHPGPAVGLCHETGRHGLAPPLPFVNHLHILGAQMMDTCRALPGLDTQEPPEEAEYPAISL